MCKSTSSLLHGVIEDIGHGVYKLFSFDKDFLGTLIFRNKNAIIFVQGEHIFLCHLDKNEKLKMDNHIFRHAINKLLEDEIIEMIGKGRSTRYVLKLSSPQHSYIVKKLLRLIEDNIIHRE